MEKQNFLTLAKNRKTTYEFSERKLSDGDLKLILEAGRWAPSCQNTQPWHFVVVKDKEKIKLLIKTADYGDFHTLPSLIIALLLIQKRCPGDNFSGFPGKDTANYDSFMCLGMAGLQMVLQAAERGINSCMLTPVQQTAKKILHVPKEDTIPLMIGFGYQMKSAFQQKRERKELSEIVSWELFDGKKWNRK